MATKNKGKKAGSRWEQTLVFPADQRYFFATDKITTVNASNSLFLRIDTPVFASRITGHPKVDRSWPRASGRTASIPGNSLHIRVLAQGTGHHADSE